MSNGFVQPQGIMEGAGGNAISQMLSNRYLQDLKFKQENSIQSLVQKAPEMLGQLAGAQVNVAQAKGLAQQYQAQKLKQDLMAKYANDPNSSQEERDFYGQKQAGLDHQDQEYLRKMGTTKHYNNALKTINETLNNPKTGAAPLTSILGALTPEQYAAIGEHEGIGAGDLYKTIAALSTIPDEANKQKFSNALSQVPGLIAQEVKGLGGFKGMLDDPTLMAIAKQRATQKFRQMFPDNADQLSSLVNSTADESIGKISGLFEKFGGMKNDFQQTENQGAQIQASIAQAKQELLLKAQELAQQGKYQDALVATQQAGNDNELLKIVMAKKGNAPTINVTDDGILQPTTVYKNLTPAMQKYRNAFTQQYGKPIERVTADDLKNPKLFDDYNNYIKQFTGGN